MTAVDQNAGHVGRAVLAATAVIFVLVALPVVWRGAPLADDFNNCVAADQLGVRGFLLASWHQLGALRPARFLEIALTSWVCRSLPFGIAIVVPILLTLTVALLAQGLLRDLGTPQPWAALGGALWLLQPLGTEAGLWPAALHVPLGLALAVGALRLYRRERLGMAALANLLAVLSTEQVIFALPLAAWLVSPPRTRWRATFVSAVVGLTVIVSFFMFPGGNPRLRSSLLSRVTGLIENPTFYFTYPAVGLGLHSMPLAVAWAMPWSLMVLPVGALVGSIVGPAFARPVLPLSPSQIRRAIVVVAALVVLTNLVVLLAVPRQGSPRVFTPTWLVLAIATAAGAASVRCRHPRLAGAAVGLFAVCAVLSLAFSVFVRLRSADFTERAAGIVASRARDGGSVAVCGVRRTVVHPAPRGAFAVHEFIYDWAAERAVTYYTGRHVRIYLAGELWSTPCRSPGEVDAVLDFDDLLARRSP